MKNYIKFAAALLLNNNMTEAIQVPEGNQKNVVITKNIMSKEVIIDLD